MHKRLPVGIALFSSLSIFFAMASGATHDLKADEAVLIKWIAHKYSTNECGYGVGIDDDSISYFDFNHDGKDELIVNASTCWTGTAGDDVHSVLSPNDNGGFTELEIPEIDKQTYDAAEMVGNRNYRLSVEKGLLVATWHDRSERKGSPLIIKYKWNGKGFTVLTAKTFH